MRIKDLKEIFSDIRSILAIIGLLALVSLSVYELVALGSFNLPEILGTIVTAIVMFYFGTKAKEENNEK